MKSLPRKILPLLSASFFIFRHEDKNQVNIEDNLKQICTKAKLDTILDKKISKTKHINLELQKFINNLNDTQVYLLVTNPESVKLDKKILLLLHTQSRLSSEQTFINKRHKLYLFGGIKEVKKCATDIDSIESLRPNYFPVIATTLHSAKNYYINNLGGYKSICPVFFDKNTAESFLIDSSKDALYLAKNLPLNNKNNPILNGLLNTKIISVGLGDFIDYYSSTINKKFLDQIEFLFFPQLEEISSISSSSSKNSSKSFEMNSFKVYQEKYYSLKNSF